MRESKVLKSFTLQLIICCWVFVGLSQNAFRFQNYSITDGLSQSSVLCILQDDNYGLWVGTQDGLNKFDGKRFEVFTSEQTNGIEGSQIRSAVKMRDGNLWFGTGNGLTHYDPNTEKFTTYNVKNEALSIEKIVEAKNNTIWLITAKSVWSFDTKTKKFSPQTLHLGTSQPRSIFVSQQNIIYVVNDDAQVVAYNPTTKSKRTLSFKPKKQGNLQINTVYQHQSSELLFGTNQGIYGYNENTFQTSSRFTELDTKFGLLSITSMLNTPENQWYFGTSKNGLISIQANKELTQCTQDVFQKNALLFNEINCLYRDFSGVIWVGTGRGISSFDPINQGFLGIGPSGNLDHGIPASTVWSFAEHAKGNYLFVGTDVGVSRMNRNTGRFEQFYRNANQESSSENAILSMYALNENHVLITAVDGIFELKITDKNTYRFEKLSFIDDALAKKHKRAYRIKKYSENKYFVATSEGVLLLDFAKRKVQEFVHDKKNSKKSISPGICRLIYQNKKGSFLFATSSGGLNVLNTQNKDSLFIEPYKFNSFLRFKHNEYITDIVEFKANDYWFGTMGAGLVHWNERSKKTEIFTKKSGLPNNVIYNILVDGKRLWLSTNKGLSCFDTKHLNAKNYSEINGLLSNEFNMGAALKSVTGELFFGGISGYNFFNPKTITNEGSPVEVVFTKFKLDKGWLAPNDKDGPLKKPIALTKELMLDYHQHSFVIRFQPTNLYNPELVNYKYILEGSDEGEIEIGNSNELRFNSLSSGTYTLKVYARVGDGKWCASPATLIISIESPFWFKWWFWLISAFFLFIVVRFSIRKRIDHERREQVRLEMKIAERTQEIREQNKKIEKQKNQLLKKKEKVERQRQELEIEKEKSETILRNVIPDSMATELLETGEVSARAFKVVSVLFTDFVGFTKIADRTEPTELVRKLDVFFRKFDEIVFSNNLEKIKTIGDAYMCAGGVPVRNSTNPIDACLVGLQIQNYMEGLKQEALDANREYWSLRLGINTGDVIAGVIGSKRLAYDVWGTTVNHAQRMEMLGQPGKVTITSSTFLLIEPYFECKFLGVAETKSKGEIDMYEVSRIKPELSIDGNGIYPNERFRQIVNLHHYSSINYYNAERFIMNQLEKRLSPQLHYHSIGHTKDVVNAVERLALSENVTDEGLFLLKTAANYHDAGFVEQYEKNEPVGVRWASEVLPQYGYTEEHLEIIKELIYVTAIPHKPKNNLEQIICDADLDYLGRDDFHEIADRLRLELREHGKINSDRAWDEIQVKFLTEHRYFTKTALATRQAKKLQNLEEVKARLLRNEYVD